MFKKTRVYLDHAAATPLGKAVFLAMKPYLTEVYGNASAIHTEGLVARQAVDTARARVASTLQVRPECVTFTSGGTESNNIALIGVIEHLLSRGRSLGEMEVVTTRIEHPSVMETMRVLEARGVVVRYVGVTEEGLVKLDELQTLLSEKTVLFSVAYANSEIGVVQKVRAIKKVLDTAEKKFKTKIFFHVDAAQAPLWLSCQMETVHADLLALDVGKCNGPKGVGILVQSRRVQVRPVLFGGGQESGLRPGTENVAGMVGASVALELAQKDFKRRAEKVSGVRDAGIAHMLKEIPQAVLNGVSGEDRLANNINISIPGLDTEFATVVLDKHGFAVSTKSACAGAGGAESAVVKEISGDSARSRATLRISLSPETKLTDIKALTIILKAHIEKMSSLTNL
ncbi:MAG: cysteine desulfurase [Candidatus Pacebacteria bacterium]|nr:cysteine desulfurase [Candidatus Paceibacterota bacterium]MBP9842385.1 cysteine desulfurase [Candidatus Paceibacterota bacterium]